MRPTTIIATLMLALGAQAALHKRETRIDPIDIEVEGDCDDVCDRADDTIDDFVDRCYDNDDDERTTFLPDNPTTQQYECICDATLFNRFRDCLNCYHDRGRQRDRDSDDLRNIADTMNQAIDKCNSGGNVQPQIERVEFREPEDNGASGLKPTWLVGLIPLLGLL